MADRLVLRCSSLPLAHLCPGSVRPSALAINDTSVAAETGTTAHIGLRPLVEHGRIDWEAVPAQARDHGINETELRVLLALGAKLWNVVRESFPDALTEVPLAHEGPGYVLTGHVDIYGRSVNTARLADWKAGRLDANHREQLLGYAALALFDDHTLEDAAGGILWIREGDFEPYSLKRSELQAWEDRLVAEVVEWNGEYRPGPHCAHCRRNHECVAANALMRRDLAIVADRNLVGHVEDAETLAKWTPEQKIDIAEKARAAHKLIERVLGALKADVLRNGGEVSDGKRKLTIVTEPRRYLDPVKAFPILAEAGFTDEDMAEVIEMTAAKAERVVARKAPPRKGAQAVRELQKQLEAAEAIQTTEIQKMVSRRV